MELHKSAPISLRMDKWYDRILGSSEEFSALTSVHVKLIWHWVTGTFLGWIVSQVMPIGQEFGSEERKKVLGLFFQGLRFAR